MTKNLQNPRAREPHTSRALFRRNHQSSNGEREASSQKTGSAEFHIVYEIAHDGILGRRRTVQGVILALQLRSEESWLMTRILFSGRPNSKNPCPADSLTGVVPDRDRNTYKGRRRSRFEADDWSMWPLDAR